MAAISENKKNGKTVSFRFVVCLGRDAQQKQIRRITTWTPSESMTPTKARKAAERAAEDWEQEVRAEYQSEQEAAALGQSYHIPPEKRHDDFVSFINDTWMPLQVRSGSRKPSTVAFYGHMVKLIIEYFNGAVLQQISPMDIQKYLIYLRTDYKSKLGKPLAPKSLHHQYTTLKTIFGYAEQQEIISKNPMHKVEAPKKKSTRSMH